MPAQKRIPTTLRNSGNSAGAVNEEDFRKAFTQVPKCDIYSAKELQSQLESIRQVLENSQLDWSQRVNSLKLLRSILINGGMDFENELITGVHCLEDALITSVKDLRSQVCREACLTVSFLCEKLEASIVRLCEAILPATIGLIQNSAKIMSSSGANACYFIVKHVEHPKLIPIVLSYSSSKSKEIRKIVQDLVNQMLAIWTPAKLEKSLSGIIDCIKPFGIGDQEKIDLSVSPGMLVEEIRKGESLRRRVLATRIHRHALLLGMAISNWINIFRIKLSFSSRHSLDPAKQRSLSGAMSAASSSQSINSERDSLHMAHRPGGLGLNRPKTTSFFAGRSASEIDANAVRRAAAYTPAKSKLTGSVATRNTPARPSVVRSGIPPSRQTPLKTNNSVNPPGSVSQPGSRSTSPSRTGANRRPAPVSSTPSVMSSSRIGIGRPRQIGTREASPRRFSGGTLNRGASANGHAAGNDTRQLCNAIRNFSLTADDEEFSLGVLRYDQAGLTDALNACTSSNLNERKDGLRSLLEILKSRRNIPPPDIKKICDVLNKLLTEGNHKLLSMVMDILNVFVSSYHDSLGDWLQFLLLRLLHKSGVEILPTVVQPLNMALKAVRTTFRPELQLIAICKNIQDPIQTPPVKAKAATLNYLHELLQGMEQGSNLSRDEVRGAVQKIFQWMEDPKNVSIKLACERVIYDFFSLNTADFSTILSTYPPQWREFAYSLLKKNKPSESAVPRSPAAAPVHEAISDMSAQITDYVDSRGVMGPLTTSANLSASPANVSHLLNGSSSRAVSNANDTDLSLGSIGEIESTLYLKDDVHQQNKFIAELLNELSNLDPLRRSEQNHALQTLQQMVSEGSLTTWEENFKSLILHIFNVLAVNDVTLKRSALKLLTKICVAQAVSFYDLAEMTLFKVLDSIAEEENPQVMNVADECLKTLATHFPLHVVIRATKPIIAQENDPRVGPALKMLTRLIESLDVEELTARLPEIAPGVVNCYSNPQSSVRKSTVFCLVAMVNKLGREPVNPYLTSLSNSKRFPKGIKNEPTEKVGVFSGVFWRKLLIGWAIGTHRHNSSDPSTRGVHSANTDVFYTFLTTVTSP
ncbi:HEAT repeat protein [Ancylostoma caninum]|uniref:HEAT repeat protein n=1 Tax=Ancylostoma caninum TaxID=29170 RepID=A0A368GPF4_ANCCA|nr:HEAT repeat protein [Ancylostoma caninum]